MSDLEVAQRVRPLWPLIVAGSLVGNLVALLATRVDVGTEVLASLGRHLDPLCSYVLLAVTGSLTFAVVATLVGPWRLGGTVSNQSVSWRGRLYVASQWIAGTTFSVFRYAAENRGVAFAATAAVVFGSVVAWDVFSDERALFSFVYATLLFLQVLVTQDQPLLRLGELTRDSGADGESETTAVDGTRYVQDVGNVGTDVAQNVTVLYRIYDLDGTPRSGRRSADVASSALRIEPGKWTDPEDIPVSVPDDDRVLVRLVVKTGDGVSLTAATGWEVRP